MKWNRQTEHLLDRYRRDAHDQMLLFDKAGRAERKNAKWYTMMLVAIGSVTSSTSFIDFSDGCDTSTNRIVAGILAIVMTILVGFGRVLNYDATSEQMFSVAALYRDLELEIDEQMSRDPKDRQPPKDFMFKVKTTLKKIDQGPKLPDSVFEKYIKDFEKHVRDKGAALRKEREREIVRSPSIPMRTIQPNKTTATVSPAIHKTPNARRLFAPKKKKGQQSGSKSFADSAKSFDLALEVAQKADDNDEKKGGGKSDTIIENGAPLCENMYKLHELNNKLESMM